MLCYVMLCYVMLCYGMGYVLCCELKCDPLAHFGPFLPRDRSYSRQFLLTASCEPLIRRVKVLELVSWGNTRPVPILHCQLVPFPTSNWTEHEIPGRWLLHRLCRPKKPGQGGRNGGSLPRTQVPPQTHTAQCTQVNAQWRKVKQMQQMWRCILLCRQYKDKLENTQWRKTKPI